MIGAAEAGGARRHVVRAVLAVVAVYLPYVGLLVFERWSAHDLRTLLKILPVAPGLVPTSLAAFVLPDFMVRHEALRMVLAGVVALAQAWLFGRWALRGSNRSAPLAFVVNLPMCVILEHWLRM